VPTAPSSHREGCLFLSCTVCIWQNNMNHVLAVSDVSFVCASTRWGSLSLGFFSSCILFSCLDGCLNLFLWGVGARNCYPAFLLMSPQDTSLNLKIFLSFIPITGACGQTFTQLGRINISIEPNTLSSVSSQCKALPLLLKDRALPSSCRHLVGAGWGEADPHTGYPCNMVVDRRTGNYL
jgi:hypothetical protein